MMYLDMDLFVFIVLILGVYQASLMYKLMFFIRFGKFAVIISLSIFLLFSIFSFWYSHYMYVAVFNGVSHFTEALLIFSSFFFLSVFQIV